MQRFVPAFVAALALSVSLAASGQNPPVQEQQQSPQPKDITLTGCLVQDAETAEFVLEKAKVEPANQNEPSRDYTAIPAADVDLRMHLNHQVQVTGLEKAADPGREQTEPELPVFEVKTVTAIADTCADQR